jgi:hypothetical protein
MTELRAAIARLLEDPLDALLARSILGSDDPDAITGRVAGFVADAMGRRVAACPLFIQSVGAVFGLDLDDGSRVAIKVHALADGRQRGFGSSGELAAVYDAQEELAAAGLPCARVLVPPRPFAPGAEAAVLAWLDAPAPDDAHAPSTRRALAEGLARIAALGRSLSPAVQHRLPRSRLPATVFALPHNALFNLDAPGGEWIDARARRARAILDEAGPPAVMHTDFSCANIRVAGGAIAALYDMDSVAWIDEPRCVASAAVHFTYTGENWTWPSRDEARAFAAGYEAARGRPFTVAERRRLDAGAIHAMAYTARCEHGLGEPRRAMGDALAAAPDDYLSGI